MHRLDRSVIVRRADGVLERHHVGFHALGGHGRQLGTEAAGEGSRSVGASQAGIGQGEVARVEPGWEWPSQPAASRNPIRARSPSITLGEAAATEASNLATASCASASGASRG